MGTKTVFRCKNKVFWFIKFTFDMLAKLISLILNSVKPKYVGLHSLMSRNVWGKIN